MKFKAGDIVRFVYNPAVLSMFTLGRDYVVKRVEPNKLFVDDDKGVPNYFHFSEVELIVRKCSRNLPEWW